jgi:hypothetical protein
MPGGGGKGGSSPSGNTTTTTINPTQQAQLPFLVGARDNAGGGWNRAAFLADNNPLQYYPGQTLADFNPNLGSGYQSLIDTGLGLGSAVQGPANAAFNSAVSGGYGVQNSPAMPLFNASGAAATGLASGTNPLQMDLGNRRDFLTNVLAQSAIQDPYSDQLRTMAYGAGGIGSDIGQINAFGGMAASNPYASALAQYASNNINGIGSAYGMLGTAGSAALNNPYAAQLSNLASAGSGAAQDGSQYNNLAADAYGSGSSYSQQLQGLGTGNINGLGSAYGMIGGAGNGAGRSNLGERSLGATASGAFLNQNPYIDRQYQAAADPVTRNYMTATAPQTDSNYEAAGRYGSGVLGNARSQNEQNLGKTLGDLGANLYGQDYANERGLMTNAAGTLGSLINQRTGLQTAAGSALGSLGLGELAGRSNTLNQAGDTYLRGIGASSAALGQRDAVLQNELGIRGNIYNQAGGQYLGGINSGISAGGALGSLGLNEFTQRGNLVNQAGNQYLSGLQTGIGAGTAAGNLENTDYAQRANVLQNAGNHYLQSQGLAQNAFNSGSNLDLYGLNSMLGGISGATGAANGLQTGYQGGNSLALQGLALQPSVTAGNLAPAQALIQGGTGLTGLSQAQITDAMNRFYGVEQAPWQTLTQYMNAVGQPTSGSSQQTQPYFTNPTANLLGGATGALGLANGVGSAFGSGGLFGGGSGAFGTAAAGTGPFSIGGGVDLASGIGDLGAASTAADFGGGGIASALPFAAATVICTELRRQGRMPKRYYIAAARADAKIPQIVRAGYHAWAIPSVRHLRRKPNSLYSRLLEKTFNWRAEDLAARAGVKGARKMWRGRMVTAALALPCLALGLLCRKADLAGLYDAHKICESRSKPKKTTQGRRVLNLVSGPAIKAPL